MIQAEEMLSDDPHWSILRNVAANALFAGDIHDLATRLKSPFQRIRDLGSRLELFQKRYRPSQPPSTTIVWPVM